MTQRAYLLSDVLCNPNRAKSVAMSDLFEFAAKKPIKSMSIKKCSHWAYHSCWSDNDHDFYSIFQVLMQKSKFKKHVRRINTADLSCPIIVIEDLLDEIGVILDGNHRFAKLLESGAKRVKYVKISIREFYKLAE